MKFATYLYKETALTSRPVDEIEFKGYSYPHFNAVREELSSRLSHFDSLNVRKADLDDFLVVHSKTYLEQLRAMAAGKKLDQYPNLSMDCRGLEFCLPGYEFGLGGMYEAIDKIKSKDIQRAYCFSLGGHHAYSDWGHGYCILNPMAVAARYAQQNGFGKVLIVDWDIHHGDGTQSIFANDPTVHCISIHSAADLYMAFANGLRYGTTTTGKSLGHQNIPILSKAYDDEFKKKIEWGGVFYRAEESIDAFANALTKIPWSPDLIFIFSGYDSHKEDQGHDITNWTNNDFVTLTKLVLDLSQKPSCPVLSVHGGGYNLPVTVSAAYAHVETLADY